MTSKSAFAIETEGLTKTFGKTRAVDGIDLAVRTGAVYSVLGPNGAGKTTTIRMLATLLRPDEGSARVFGHDVVREAGAVRRRISLTGQSTAVDEDLTGLQNILLAARLQGFKHAAAKARATALLEAFDLTDVGNRLLKTYSGGERRRIDIAASIVVRPDLLFLDEPTTGLDPRSRSDVWSIIRAFVAEGATVLLTTQYLDEADRLSDRIALIDHGKLVAEGTPAELKSRTGSGSLQVGLRDADQREAAERVLAETLGGAVDLEPDPTRLTARVSDPERATRALTELTRSGIEVNDFALGQPSLDEVFLALTGHAVVNGSDTKEEEEVRA